MGVEHLLQGMDLVYQGLVGTGQVDKLLLQRLDLLLLGEQGLLEEVDGLGSGEGIFRGLRLPLRRGFPPDVV